MSEAMALPEHGGSCPACGYPHEAGEHRCEKCGRRLEPSGSGHGRSEGTLSVNLSSPPSSPKNASQPQHPGTEPIRHRNATQSSVPARGLPEDLRKQLSARVEQFRSRQLQPPLPLQFAGDPNPDPKVISIASRIRQALGQKETSRKTRTVRRLRTSSPQQPILDFPSLFSPAESFSVPLVAPVRLQMMSHAIDVALTLAAFVVFASSVRLLTGPLAVDPLLVASLLLAYGAIALGYGAVFLCLAGATPAMKWLGLRLVDFDGRPPFRRQLFWRFLGAFVSAGSFLLGFLWAAIDEEHLSWHDRISKTFLTIAVEQSGLPGSAGSPQQRALHG